MKMIKATLQISELNSKQQLKVKTNIFYYKTNMGNKMTFLLFVQSEKESKRFDHNLMRENSQDLLETR